MAKLSNIRRILREDYPSDSQETIERLAGILNPFMEQITRAFDKQLDFTNLAQEIIKFTAKTDSNGTPIEGGKIKLSLSGRIAGVTVLNARNLDNVSHYPDSQPFLSTSTTAGIMTVNNITGLQTNERYELTILVYKESAD